MAHEAAGVDAAPDRNAMFCEKSIGGLIGTPIALYWRELAGDEPFDVRPDRLAVIASRAVVADLGVCKNDDLSGIGWIGEDFLITGEGSIKDDLARTFNGRAKRAALEDRTVFQGEDRCAQPDGPPEDG